MQLVAYGSQDIYLTGNPQITFFKLVYRRHTNFSMESIKQTFDGNANFGGNATATISRNGDLVHRMYLEHSATFTHNTANNDRQINLVERYGDSLIKECEIEIGGQRIDRHTSMWNRVYSDLTEFNPTGHYGGSDVNLGVTPTRATGNSTLIDYMKGNTNGYNTGNFDLDNNFMGVGGNSINGFDYRRGATGSIPSRITVNKIFLPLNFWFNRNPGLALPLIALQYHEVKIKMVFESSSDLARQGDDSHHDNSSPITTVTADGNFDLWCDYIYLDTDERRRFAQVSHEYLIDQLQIKNTTVSQATEKVELNFNHPVKELIWTMRNETLGASTDLGSRHQIPATQLGDGASGPVSLDQIGGNWKLKLNGHDRFKQRDTRYFTRTQVWQHHTGYGGIPTGFSNGRVLNAPSASVTSDYFIGGNDSIAVYSFSLKPEEHQPSGTCNFSRIDNAELIGTELQGFARTDAGGTGRLVMTNLPNVNANNIRLTIFAVNYNVLRIMSGMGGLAYSN